MDQRAPLIRKPGDGDKDSPPARQLIVEKATVGRMWGRRYPASSSQNRPQRLLLRFSAPLAREGGVPRWSGFGMLDRK